MFSIKQRQLDACKRMLALNFSPTSENYWQNIWKVLIYDEFCRDVLAPLFTVDELHKAGVTLHLMLNSNGRQEIPDVPAIYFVKPTPENINRICQDCASKLYDNYHLNFVSSLPRPLLEELAKRALESDSIKQISKIYDQYLDFVSLEDSLFILNQKNSYFGFHNPTISDQEASSNIDFIVDSLFSVLVTLGKIPIIQCPKGDAAELIAVKLDQKIRGVISTTPNIFTESAALESLSGSSFQRPVLLLLDRNIDISVMLSHSWSYQSLVHDLCDMHLNRVKINLVDKHNKPTSYSYDFNSIDTFWETHAGNPFPTVLQSIKENVVNYERKLGGKKPNDIEKTEASSESLSETIALLPELVRQKDLIAQHVNIAECLLKLVNTRNLDEFFKLEEDIICHQSQPADVIGETLRTLGDPSDKLRLFLIYYLSNSKKMSPEELSMFEKLLLECGCDLLPLRYLQKIKAFDQHWATINKKSKDHPVMAVGKDWLDLFSSIVSKGIEQLIPRAKDYYVTHLVNSVMDLSEEKDVKDYLYLDPKFGSTGVPRKNTPFKEAIVFMIGGGNYLEYQNIKDSLKRKTHSSSLGIDRKMIYGCTEMLNGNMFLQQLSALGGQYKK